jgi:hypothetical protein
MQFLSPCTQNLTCGCSRASLQPAVPFADLSNELPPMKSFAKLETKCLHWHTTISDVLFRERACDVCLQNLFLRGGGLEAAGALGYNTIIFHFFALCFLYSRRHL